ncbi:MAG: phosphate/phosphite/phosphonate ABC transporter substrate-binding protein [Granulosicoccus sp.]
MIASLMMYERVQLASSHRRFWSLIRQELNRGGIASPEALSQSADEFTVWLNPELVLSQTCGMPYRLWLHDKVKLVGTPDYRLADCKPGYYRSAIVVRQDDPRQELSAFKRSTFAFNQPFSQSGYAAPYRHTQEHSFWFTRKYQSGGHLASALAVAQSRADIASLDAVSWRLIQEHEAFSEKLRVLEWTAPTPGLPFITALKNNEQLIFEAVTNALAKLPQLDRGLLGIEGLVNIPADDYLAVATPELSECHKPPY